MGHVYLGNNTPLHECMTSYVVCRGMEVGVSHFFVMFGREMLCEVFRLVVCPFVPEQKELALSYSISDPVYVHVERFRFFLSDGRCENTMGSTVVGPDSGRRLRMSQFL